MSRPRALTDDGWEYVYPEDVWYIIKSFFVKKLDTEFIRKAKLLNLSPQMYEQYTVHDLKTIAYTIGTPTFKLKKSMIESLCECQERFRRQNRIKKVECNELVLVSPEQEESIELVKFMWIHWPKNTSLSLIVFRSYSTEYKIDKITAKQITYRNPDTMKMCTKLHKDFLDKYMHYIRHMEITYGPDTTRMELSLS